MVPLKHKPLRHNLFPFVLVLSAAVLVIVIDEFRFFALTRKRYEMLDNELERNTLLFHRTVT